MIRVNDKKIKDRLIFVNFNKDFQRMLKSRLRNLNKFYGRKSKGKRKIPPDRCILWIIFIVLVVLLLLTKVGLILFFGIGILTLLMLIFNC
ncbi:hypothetical protein [Clostridium tarantellae]|uniref:Uncharacterized protein n=1 Tax=Clostridium tarantellae TaxID=39493 RepID=A0A6I1MMS3_9CLOT|nr:hypothetical protein [Clostridium tarantellae]MPQ42221.1 hypothetical protein [Clostridium tarantellae]